MTEAKHGIYRDGIGFKDFKNSDGVRFSYRGIRIVTFKLKEQILFYNYKYIFIVLSVIYRWNYRGL